MSIVRHFSLAVSSFVVMIGLCAPLTARAFAVSPVIIDQTQDPGSSSQGILHITNDTSQEQTYYTSIQNFVPQGEEGQQTFLPESDRSGLVSWLTLDQSMVTLKPRQSRDFRWALVVPKDAEPGGHYAAIFFSTQPSHGGESAVGVGSKTGVLFLLGVTGNVIEAASVESFRIIPTPDVAAAASARWLDHLPAYFETHIRNSGSVHIQPSGMISITNLFGNVVDKIPANPDGSRVLPNSVRNIRSSWGPKQPIQLMDHGFLADVRAEWRGFALGRYTATFAADYGRSHQSLSAQASVWIFPWRLGVIALLGLILLFLLIKGYNRLVVKSAMRRVKTG